MTNLGWIAYTYDKVTTNLV